MARVPQNMQKLIDQRDLLLREMDALRNKIAGLEMAISLIDGASPQSGSSKGRSSTSVKGVLIDLLREVGTSGINAPQAVEMANRRGITLNLGSVSSTLSRFKTDGAVQYDGDRYRLSEFVREPLQPVAEVVTHPANWSRSA